MDLYKAIQYCDEKAASCDGCGKEMKEIAKFLRELDGFRKCDSYMKGQAEEISKWQEKIEIDALAYRDVKKGRISPFQNDPFGILMEAYSNLFDAPFIAFYDQKENREGYGFTTFPDNGDPPVIVIFQEYESEIQTETLAHELAHVAVGAEHEHDSVWDAAFERLHKEYVKIIQKRFAQREDAR